MNCRDCTASLSVALAEGKERPAKRPRLAAVPWLDLPSEMWADILSFVGFRDLIHFDSCCRQAADLSILSWQRLDKAKNKKSTRCTEIFSWQMGTAEPPTPKKNYCLTKAISTLVKKCLNIKQALNALDSQSAAYRLAAINNRAKLKSFYRNLESNNAIFIPFFKLQFKIVNYKKMQELCDALRLAHGGSGNLLVGICNILKGCLPALFPKTSYLFRTSDAYQDLSSAINVGAVGASLWACKLFGYNNTTRDLALEAGEHGYTKAITYLQAIPCPQAYLDELQADMNLSKYACANITCDATLNLYGAHASCKLLEQALKIKLRLALWQRG